MNCRILHELPGRLRIHICQRRMMPAEADLLEAYLLAVPGVLEVKVNERTADAVIRYQFRYTGKAEGTKRAECPERNAIVDALAAFAYGRTSVTVPEHTGRELRRQYEEALTRKLLARGFHRLFLPVSLRSAISVVRSVPYLLRGLRSLLRGRLEVSVLDMVSIGISLLRKEYDTAGQIMFLLGIGDLMEEWTHRKSVDDLASAMALHVDRVWLRGLDGQERLTAVDAVRPGDVIVVRAGNLIPLDGEALEGDAMVNQSSLTGEPLPVHKRPGAYLYAGTVIEEGELAITVRQGAGSGRYDRIVSMIEASEKLKSVAEARASHLADRLVPWTLGAAALTWLLTRNATRAASILMVDFCCALKLSMPIAVLSAMREAGSHRIAIKGGKFLEAVAEAETLVFDKTGTLTAAAPVLRDVIPFGNGDKAELLRLAACLEEHFPHSVANAVVRAAKEQGLDHEEKHSKVEYVVAHGIASSVDGVRVCIGSSHFIFEDEGCTIPEGEEERFRNLPDTCSHLYLAIGGILAAVLLIEDPVKPEAPKAVQALHDLGLSRVVMMTGDSAHTARAVAAHVGVDAYRAEVLPEDKAAFVRSERTAGRKVIMIGDGVNDSPALSEADAGVAVSSGAAIAREIADITISSDDLMTLAILRALSVALMQRIRENYRTIIAFNAALIGLGMVGILPPSAAALLHNASTIAISLHSMTDLLPQETTSP